MRIITPFGEHVYAQVLKGMHGEPLEVFCSKECAHAALGNAEFDAKAHDDDSFADEYGQYGKALRDHMCDQCGKPVDRVYP